MFFSHIGIGVYMQLSISLWFLPSNNKVLCPALSICEERKMAAHASPCRAVGVSFISPRNWVAWGMEWAGCQVYRPYWSSFGPETGLLPLYNLLPAFPEVLSVTVEGECCAMAVLLLSSLLVHWQYCLTLFWFFCFVPCFMYVLSSILSHKKNTNVL